MPATKPSSTLSTARSEMIEVGLSALLLGRDQDGGAACARHPHGIVAVWTRRQGTAAAMGEIETVELLRMLGHTHLRGRVRRTVPPCDLRIADSLAEENRLKARTSPLNRAPKCKGTT